MLDQHRNWFKGLEVKTARMFAVFPITPNQYTSLSLVLIVVCDYFLIAGDYWFALGFFELALFMDFVDGGVARLKNMSSSRGAYWDTVADRYVDAALLFGLLFVALPEFYLPNFVWIFLALFGSLMTTYSKAAAKEKGLSETELKGGLMSRGERWMILTVILVLLSYSQMWSIILISLLAILSNITAFQRIAAALRK